MTAFTLSKQERLTSLKDIDLLFEKGAGLSKYPLRLVWLVAPEPSDVPARAVFTVSKKKFQRAVDRNRLKRLMKESYRALKPAFYEQLPAGKTVFLGIIFTGKEMCDLAPIHNSLAKALGQIVNHSKQDE